MGSGLIFGADDALDSGEREFLHVPQLVTQAGDTVLHTPPPGHALRLRWVYALNDPASATPALITIRLGDQVLFVVYGISKRQRVTGAEGAPLVVSLDVAGKVAATFIVEEVPL